uniref:NADH dehydrogenase subunit 4 n=1 Tax=Cordax unidentatus TaxID=3021430 RepID=UPI0030FEED52|nr:NADH dehydrogenase subunit 4 [Cordax unidentatus]
MMVKLLIGTIGMMIVAGLPQGWGILTGWMFVLSLASIAQFNPQGIWSSVGTGVGVDLLGIGLVWLSIWVTALMILSSSKINDESMFTPAFLILSIVLVLILEVTFSTMHMLMFYVSFEASLIPTLMLILGWGYQPERMQAGLYLMIYTLLASLPLLMGLMKVGSENSFLFFVQWKVHYEGLYMYLSLILAFMVKMPMFLTHLWLPKAHVEAPVAGSMILAGVLLKMGGYGLLRMLPFILPSAVRFNYWWVALSLVGGITISCICMRQTDMKCLVAYSSVAHMGLTLSGLMTMTTWGLNGAYMMMVAHGICSSGLFVLVNVVYERTGSRSLLINRGLLNLMPNMALGWFLFNACNMAAPPSINLLGEVSLFMGILNWTKMSIVALMLISFMAAVYSLYLYAFSQHGNVYSALFVGVGGSVREYLILGLHWIPLNLLIMKGELGFSWL